MMTPVRGRYNRSRVRADDEDGRMNEDDSMDELAEEGLDVSEDSFLRTVEGRKFVERMRALQERARSAEERLHRTTEIIEEMKDVGGMDKKTSQELKDEIGTLEEENYQMAQDMRAKEAELKACADQVRGLERLNGRLKGEIETLRNEALPGMPACSMDASRAAGTGTMAELQEEVRSLKSRLYALGGIDIPPDGVSEDPMPILHSLLDMDNQVHDSYFSRAPEFRELVKIDEEEALDPVVARLVVELVEKDGDATALDALIAYASGPGGLPGLAEHAKKTAVLLRSQDGAALRQAVLDLETKVRQAQQEANEAKESLKLAQQDKIEASTKLLQITQQEKSLKQTASVALERAAEAAKRADEAERRAGDFANKEEMVLARLREAEKNLEHYKAENARLSEIASESKENAERLDDELHQSQLDLETAKREVYELQTAMTEVGRRSSLVSIAAPAAATSLQNELEMADESYDAFGLAGSRNGSESPASQKSTSSSGGSPQRRSSDPVETETLWQQVSDLEAQIRAKDAELASMRAEVESKDEQLQQARNLLEMTRSELEHFQRLCRELAETLEQICRKSHGQQHKSPSDEANNLLEKLQNLTDAKSLADTVSKIVEGVASLPGEIEQLRTEAQASRITVERLTKSEAAIDSLLAEFGVDPDARPQLDSAAELRIEATQENHEEGRPDSAPANGSDVYTKVAALRSIFKKVRLECDIKDERIHELEAAQAKADSVAEQLSLKEEANKALMKKIGEKKEEISKLKSNVDKHTAETAASAKLQEELAAVKLELSEARRSHSFGEKETEQLREDLARCNDRVKALEAELEQAGLRIGALAAELEKTKDELARSQDTNKLLSAQFESARDGDGASIADRDMKLDQLMSENRKLRDVIDRQNEHQTASQAQISEAKDKVNQLQQRLQVAELQVGAADKQGKLDREQCEGFRKKLQDALTDIGRLSEALRQVTTSTPVDPDQVVCRDQLSELQGRVGEVVELLQGGLARPQKGVDPELEKAPAKISELMEGVSKAIEAIGDSGNTMLNHLGDAIDDIRSRVADVRMDLNAKALQPEMPRSLEKDAQTLSAVEQQVRDAEETIRQLSVEKEGLERSRRANWKLAEETQTELAKERAERGIREAEHKRDVGQKDSEIDRLAAKLREYQARVAGGQEQFEKIKADLEKKKQELADQVGEVEKLRSRSRSRAEPLKEESGDEEENMDAASVSQAAEAQRSSPRVSETSGWGALTLMHPPPPHFDGGSQSGYGWQSEYSSWYEEEPPEESLHSRCSCGCDCESSVDEEKSLLQQWKAVLWSLAYFVVKTPFSSLVVLAWMWNMAMMPLKLWRPSIDRLKQHLQGQSHSSQDTGPKPCKWPTAPKVPVEDMVFSIISGAAFLCIMMSMVVSQAALAEREMWLSADTGAMKRMYINEGRQHDPEGSRLIDMRFVYEPHYGNLCDWVTRQTNYTWC